MAEEEVAVITPVEVSESITSELKRKLEDIQPDEEEADAKRSTPDAVVDLPKDDSIVNSSDAKKPRLNEDEPVLENGHQVETSDVVAVENNDAVKIEVENNVQDITSEDVKPENQPENVDSGDVPVINIQTENVQGQSVEVPREEDVQKPSGEVLKNGDAQYPLQDQQQSVPDTQTTTKKMQVPNNKVGVLIGKAGDTIRTLQLNSGAKIQITRDSEADPFSTTRPVELIGTLDNINKAEKLIKDVIAEAEAGGSPSLVARDFGTVQATGAAEQIQISVPNEKVGLIFGKGGEIIKNMQTRSGARLQLLPHHLS